MRRLLYRLQSGWTLWEALRFSLVSWWRRLTLRDPPHPGPWRTFPARCTWCGLGCQLVAPVDPVVVRTHYECARCLRNAVVEIRPPEKNPCT